LALPPGGTLPEPVPMSTMKDIEPGIEGAVTSFSGTRPLITSVDDDDSSRVPANDAVGRMGVGPTRMVFPTVARDVSAAATAVEVEDEVTDALSADDADVTVLVVFNISSPVNNKAALKSHFCQWSGCTFRKYNLMKRLAAASYLWTANNVIIDWMQPRSS
jgi:hypothetical protein